MSKTVNSPRTVRLPRYSSTFNVAGVQIASANGSLSASWTDSVTYGENIPEWRKKLSEGVNVTTPLNAVRQRLTFVPGVIDSTYVGAPPFYRYVRHTGVLDSPLSADLFSSDPSALSETEADNRAKTMFVKKAKQVNTTFDGGTFLGELLQTLHGIRHPAEALRRGLTSYRREALKLRQEILLASKVSTHAGLDLRSISRSVNGRNAIREFSKASSGLWLESQFHWRPLLSDIDSGMKTLASRFERRPPLQRVTAVGEVTTSPKPTFQSYGLLSPTTTSVTTEITDVASVKVIYRGAIRMLRHQNSVADPTLWGFNLENFVPTMWELAPWSWAYDYFSNIGDVLNAWSLLRSSVAWSAKSVRKVTLRTRKASSVALQPSYTFSVVLGSRTVGERLSISRGVYSGDFIPTIQLELPGLSTKWINLGALATNRLADRFL